MNKGDHDGIGVGFACPNGDSDTAYIDFVKDEEGYLTGMLCTCVHCGEEWVDA